MSETRYALTEQEMTAIEAIAKAGTAEHATSVIKIVIGLGLFQQTDPIVPSSLQIPEEQWKEICGWLNEGGDRVSGGLMWMNYGPSTYDTQEVS